MAGSALGSPRHASRARGACSNAVGRYEALTRERFDDGWGSEEPPLPLRTTHTPDASRTVLSFNRSPDVPFDRSINPYRGCEHGCVYCYARPSHAWLGLSPGLDFESRLFYKPQAAERLRAELARPNYRCAPIALGTNTDPYQPLERRLGITRSLLETLAACNHPLTITTKSWLIERDVDLLADLAQRRLCRVAISVTTLDRSLARALEPRAAAPERRLRTIAGLRAAGIPVTVLVAPLIPALNDAELEGILERARGAGAGNANFILLRLPGEVGPLFEEWLQSHFPDRARHVLGLVRDSHGGQLYDARFGRRMRGAGAVAALIARRFDLACRRLEFGEPPGLDCTAFRAPRGTANPQLSLF